jgi:small-conductance mechanosensitive channel
MASLRGVAQPELSKKLFKIIKSENHVIGAYESASRERISIASQLSDWGEATNDESISDISDKLGVLLSEIGEQEDVFAQNLEDYRGVLKQIRNTESSVQPSRDHKAKIGDEIAKLKYKEPTSLKIVQLEQELVRAEAQNLVAEAQLTNIVCASGYSFPNLRTHSLARPARSSRKPTTCISPLQSSAPRNKSC